MNCSDAREAMALYVAGGLALFSLLVGLCVFAHSRKEG